MIPGVRISPLDGTVERDGVSVGMSRDESLVFELFYFSPGRFITPRDIYVRLNGTKFRLRDVSRKQPKNVVYRTGKAVAPLGLTIEAVRKGWQMRAIAPAMEAAE